MPAKEFYLLIKNIPFYLQNKKDDDNENYIEEKLKDYLTEKINKDINELFQELNNTILNQKFFENRYKCNYCGKKNKQPLYYKENQNEKIFFHQCCYKGKDSKNLIQLDEDYKEIEKFELFKKCKKK